MDIRPILTCATGAKPRAAIFLSGGGSNAERLLAGLAADPAGTPWTAAALVTDAPETSRARELGARFNVPVVAEDIRAFYRAHGETRVSVATPRGRELRTVWTDRLRAALAPLKPDFGVLAGFVPLCNITGDFPCLNVHPGDLTYLKDGKRWLVGLHTVPIERAILEGLDDLRSSVIQALPFTGGGEDMDNGPLLGVSEEVAIDFDGATPDELRAAAAARPAQRPPGGYNDRLEAVAKRNQERLKEQGDWVVLPRTVAMFARGRYGVDPAGGLWLRINDAWQPIATIVFGADTAEVRFRG